MQLKKLERNHSVLHLECLCVKWKYAIFSYLILLLFGVDVLSRHFFFNLNFLVVSILPFYTWQAIQNFYCKNCKYKQHQCFSCGKLGSSDKFSGAEV